MSRVNVVLILITLVVVGLAAVCQPIQPVTLIQTATSKEEQTDALEESVSCPVFDRTTQQIATGNSESIGIVVSDQQSLSHQRI